MSGINSGNRSNSHHLMMLLICLFDQNPKAMMNPQPLLAIHPSIHADLSCSEELTCQRARQPRDIEIARKHWAGFAAQTNQRPAIKLLF